MNSEPTHLRWGKAFDEELAELRKRSTEEPVGDGLVGLAFSGGGIRSATFGLGVLEALKQRNLLGKVHYLSTVSGGGYIGAWLTASCRRHAGWLDPRADWNDSVAHLRRYSNYLSPTVGLLSADTWSMLTIWFRNTLLVQLTVILVVACALMLPRPLLEIFRHWPGVGNLRWLSIALFLLGVAGIAGNLIAVNARSKVPLLQAKSWPLGLFGAGVCVLMAWVYGSRLGFDPFHGGQQNYLASAPIAGLLVLAAFWLQPAAVALIAFCWRGDDPPRQINYTQGWAQAVVVLPMMATGYLVAAILWGESQSASPADIGLATFDTFGQFFGAAWRYWPFPLSVVFMSLWLLSFCSVTSRRDWKGLAAAFGAPFVAVPVLHGLLCAIMLVLHGWAQRPDAGLSRAFVWGPPFVLYAFAVTVVMLIGMMGRQSSEGAREWWSRLGAWLAIYGAAWMVIAVPAVYGPGWVHWIVHAHPTVSMSAAGGWIATVLGGLFAGRSGSTGTGSGQAQSDRKPNPIIEGVAAVAPWIFIAGLLVGVATGLDKIIFLNSAQTWSSVGGDHADPSPFLEVSLLVWGGCLLALLVMAARVDINEFSLNAFYRSRLVRCYLGATRFRPGERQPQNFTGFDDGDDLALPDLTSACGGTGPLHIVNCALNLGGSSDLALHTRHSASFTLSPLHCGSSYDSRDQSGSVHQLGYVPTNRYGGEFGTPTLGQAISVSGAAASPNMGYHTSPVISFLLTVFNVRLGWWFPNPRESAVRFPSPHFSLRYLFKELFGGADDRSRFLMISDGGHFENLAAYELVRRRCRVIIISDAECDPDLKFEGLGTLIRVCDVDFGARIVVDVSAIRRGTGSAWSDNRFAIGRIVYKSGEEGVLIYLKASMSGREDTAVLQYKSSHPLFPHESTGDQFYGEDQFESYRRLGRDVASAAFDAR